MSRPYLPPRSALIAWDRERAVAAEIFSAPSIPKPLEETMKMRFLAGLVGLAISFSVPVLARETDTVDPQMAEQIRAFYQKFDQEFNRGNAAGVAAFYTEDAVYVTPHGTFAGRQAIQKSYAEFSFRRWQCDNINTKVDRISAVGNEIRSTGKWSCNFRDQAGNADHIEGHYSSVLIRDGDTWKIRRHNYSEFAPNSQALTQGRPHGMT